MLGLSVDAEFHVAIASAIRIDEGDERDFSTLARRRDGMPRGKNVAALRLPAEAIRPSNDAEDPEKSLHAILLKIHNPRGPLTSMRRKRVASKAIQSAARRTP